MTPARGRVIMDTREIIRDFTSFGDGNITITAIAASVATTQPSTIHCNPIFFSSCDFWCVFDSPLQLVSKETKHLPLQRCSVRSQSFCVGGFPSAQVIFRSLWSGPSNYATRIPIRPTIYLSWKTLDHVWLEFFFLN